MPSYETEQGRLSKKNKMISFSLYDPHHRKISLKAENNFLLKSQVMYVVIFLKVVMWLVSPLAECGTSHLQAMQNGREAEVPRTVVPRPPLTLRKPLRVWSLSDLLAIYLHHLEQHLVYIFR